MIEKTISLEVAIVSDLILFLGVMFSVGGATATIKVFAAIETSIKKDS